MKANRIFLILTAQVWIYFWRHHDNIRSRKNRQSKAFVRIYVVYHRLVADSLEQVAFIW
jgi:hypothetical protein